MKILNTKHGWFVWPPFRRSQFTRAYIFEVRSPFSLFAKDPDIVLIESEVSPPNLGLSKTNTGRGFKLFVAPAFVAVLFGTKK